MDNVLKKLGHEGYGRHLWSEFSTVELMMFCIAFVNLPFFDIPVYPKQEKGVEGIERPDGCLQSYFMEIAN